MWLTSSWFFMTFFKTDASDEAAAILEEVFFCAFLQCLFFLEVCVSAKVMEHINVDVYTRESKSILHHLFNYNTQP